MTDLYGYSNFDDYPNSYFISFCNKYFVDKFKIKPFCYWSLIRPKQIYHGLLEFYSMRLTDCIKEYLKWSRTADLEEYFKDFLTFNEIDFKQDVFISCFTQREFEFLNSKFETVNIFVPMRNSQDVLCYDKSLFDFIYTDYSSLRTFIDNNIFQN